METAVTCQQMLMLPANSIRNGLTKLGFLVSLAVLLGVWILSWSMTGKQAGNS